MLYSISPIISVNSLLSARGGLKVSQFTTMQRGHLAILFWPDIALYSITTSITNGAYILVSLLLSAYEGLKL